MFKKLKPYLISVGIALGVGTLSAFVTMGNMNVYENTVKPALAPPGWLFPVVWTILFILMGISSAIVYKKGGSGGTLFVYELQLAVNFFWSLIFFNLQAYFFAFIWLILLWVLIIIMIVRFYRVSPLAAYLQIPYLLWVTFAGYLNFMIYYLN